MTPPSPARRGIFRILGLGALTATAIAAVAGARPALAAGGNATFGVGPASATAVDGRSAFNYVLTPGAQSDDHVAVVNIGATPLVLDVYAADAVPGADGDATVQPAGAARTGAAAWVVLGGGAASGHVDLPPRSTVIVPFSLQVPTFAQAGDHVAAIVASLPTVARNSQGAAIKIDQRVVTRVFVRVDGALSTALAVSSVHAVYRQSLNLVGSGTVTFTYTVRNTGNVKVGARQTVHFTGLFGKSQDARGVPDVPVLLPGGWARTTVRLLDVSPAILGTLRVTLTPVAARGDSDPGMHVITRSDRILTLPLALLLVIGVLLAVAFALRLRRVRSRRPDRVPAMGTPA